MPATPPSARWIDDPTTLFVLSLAALLVCQALAPLLWWMAARHHARQSALGQPTDTYASAARVLGMLGTTILGLALLLQAGVWVAAGLRHL